MFVINNGDCLDYLPAVPDQSIDLVISDPPYPEISRDYGRLTENEWHILMDGVVHQVKRILKPQGSATFILQPNSRKVGSMRLWLWEFLTRTAKDWNMVQDVYWWNHTAPPNVHCHRTRGLMRPSVKYCLWFGPPDCYRRQEEVLWTASDAMKAVKLDDRALRRHPSGWTSREGRAKQAVLDRGGSTPFNLLPMSPGDSATSSGARGHGAGTPYKLCDWWIRYASPPGGTILDPFCGAGTVGEAAIENGRNFIGIEKESKYCEISQKRLL